MGTISRRHFVGATAAAAGLSGRGAGAGLPANSGIQRHVTLGRTGLQISEIGFGSASSSDPDLARDALNRGVTLFDTAESYRFGWAEEAFGEGLSGARDRIVLSSNTKAGAKDRQVDMMAALEGSLRRLRTDYLDIYFDHAVNAVERMQNEEWWAFTQRAKEHGKIRFRGVSGHGSRLVPVLDCTLDHDLADVILVVYSFAQDASFYDRLCHTFHHVDIQSELPRVLAKAKAKDVGVLAMKTLMGARLNDMKPYERDGGTFAQAAFRWVLSDPHVDALLISMTSSARIEEDVAASAAPQVRGENLHLLARYAYRQHARYCRHGCDVCEGACPQGVEIAEVLRTRMYEVDYGDRELALSDYARLGTDASACLTCSHQACLGGCSYDLPILSLTRDAAARLG